MPHSRGTKIVVARSRWSRKKARKCACEEGFRRPHVTSSWKPPRSAMHTDRRPLSTTGHIPERSFDVCPLSCCRGFAAGRKVQECMPIYQLLRSKAITGFGKLGKVRAFESPPSRLPHRRTSRFCGVCFTIASIPPSGVYTVLGLEVRRYPPTPWVPMLPFYVVPPPQALSACSLSTIVTTHFR